MKRFNTYGASTIDIPVSLESALLKEGCFLYVSMIFLQSGELYDKSGYTYEITYFLVS